MSTFQPSGVLKSRLYKLQSLFEAYEAALPFQPFLQNYFKENKNFGSNDRKFYRRAAYSFLRAEKLINEDDFVLKALYCLWLCKQNQPGEEIPFETKETETNTVEKRFAFLKERGLTNPIESLFPGFDEMEEQFKSDEFLFSHLKKKSVWLRVFPGRKDQVEKLLNSLNVQFEWNFDAIEIAGETFSHIDKLSGLAEIQDLGSQQVCNKIDVTSDMKLWDCCSGSGGKGLNLLAKENKLHLYCSDTRPNVLESLVARFENFGRRPKGVAAINLSKKVEELAFVSKDLTTETINKPFFDVIVADVPCSGSGTWGRSPEGLHRPLQVKGMVDLQRKIITNALPFLKSGGTLYFITCSVFEAENAGQVEWMKENLGLQFVEMEYIEGYKHGADNFFIAKLIKK